MELFQPVFAEIPITQALDQASQSYQQAASGNSYYRSMSESMSVVALHGGANSPTSHHRSMSESMSVTSIQGKAPNSYSRSMSEQASLTTGMPPSSPAGSQLRAAPAPATPHSASPNQRIDERLSPTLKMLGKRGDMTEKNAIGGTPVLATEFLGSMQTGSPDQFSETGETSDDASPDDNSALLRQLDAINEYMMMQESMQNAALLHASVSPVLLFGTTVIVVAKQPAVSGSRLQKAVHMLFLLRRNGAGHQVASVQVNHVLLLVLVVFAVTTIANSVEPVVGQAFADEVAGTAYKIGTTGDVAYSEWDSSTSSWGLQTSLTSAGGDIYAVKFLYSPTSHLRVIGVLESNGEIDIYYCEWACATAGNWTGPVLVADIGSSTAPRKYFDMAFEGSSGNLLIVYSKQVAASANDFFYKTFDDMTFTLSGESGFDYATGDLLLDNDVRFFKMASKPASDEIAMILLDATSSDTLAFIWNGSNFGNQITVSTDAGAAIAGESIGVAYETGSGAAIVFSADDTGGNNAKGAFARWTGSWSGPTQYDTNPAENNGAASRGLPVWYAVKANPASGSNEVMACNTDSTQNDLSCILFTAGSPGTNASIDTAIVGTTTRIFDFAWDPTGNTGTVLYEDTSGATSIKFQTWSGSAWNSAEQTITLAQNSGVWLVGATNAPDITTAVDSLWAYYSDSTTDDIGDGEWVRNSATTTFTNNGGATITGDAGTQNVEVVAMDFRKPLGFSRNMLESFGVFDTIVAKITARSIPESMGISDSVAKIVSKPLLESANVTDTSARTLLLSRSVTEQLTVQDTVSMASTKAISEQLGMTETAVRSIIVAKSMSEQMAVAETTGKAVTKLVSEQLTVTGTAARAFTGTRSLFDQLAITESIRKVVAITVTEQLGILDTIARTSILSRSTSEQLDMTESIVKDTGKSLAEQIGMTEAPTRIIVAGRTLIEQISFTETVAINIGKPITEQLTAMDALERSVIITKGITEQLVATETVAKSVSKPLSEQAGITDSLQRSTITSRTPSEQLALAETTTKAVSTMLTEQLALIELSAKSVALSRSMSEQLSGVDIISKAISHVLTEQLGIHDVLNRSITAARSAAELLTIQDTVSKAVAIIITEQTLITDQIARAIVQSRLASEQLGLTEAPAVIIGRSVSESLNTTDAVARLTIQSRSMIEQLAMQEVVSVAAAKSLSEQLSTTDALARILTVPKTMTEQLTVTDVITTAISRSMIEQLGITDNIQRSIATTKTMSEQMAVTESSTRSFTNSRTLSEQLTVQDTIAKAGARVMIEQLGIQDALATSAVASRAISEQSSLTESISTSTSKSASEQLSMQDKAGRSVAAAASPSDQLALTETVTKAVSKSISESLGMSDSPTRSAVQSGSMSEQLTIAESITPSVIKSISEQMNMSDSIGRSITLSRAMFEQLVISDVIEAQVSRAMVEQLTTQDSVSVLTVISRSATETMTLTESVAANQTKSMTEQLVISDSITAVSSHTAFVTDQIDIAESITITVTKSISDQLAIIESAIPTSTIEASDQLGVSDGITVSKAISMVDNLAMSDSIIATATGGASAADQLGVTESVAISVFKSISDILALTDAATVSGSTAMADSASLSDMIVASVTIARAVSDSLALSDAASATQVTIVMIIDSMSIGDSFADIALLVHLNLGELLVMAQSFATNFSGSFNQADNEGIIIADSVILSLTGPVNRSIAETMTIQESLTMLVMIPPPSPPAAIAVMPNLMMAKTEDLDNSGGLAEPTEAVGIDGEWDISDLDEWGLGEMLADMEMPVYDVSLEAVSGDIDDFTMILPTFWVSLEGDWANDAAFLTPTLSDLPAGMQVIVPINVKGSMDGDSGLGMLGNMTMSFSTAESAGNFTLLIMMLDSNPDGTSDDPANDLPAFFIDVTAVGDFAGATPDAEVFFEESPRLTFTLTEEWADVQATERDSNGVPVIGLFLLDESDGDWLELTAELDSPASAIDSTYTYMATLPHLSTYVVTAGEAGGEVGGAPGGATSGSRTVYVRPLLESMLITGTAGIAGEGKMVIKDITESFVLAANQAQPLHQRVITVHNLTVAVNVADVQPATVGAAVATLNFEITNRNGGGESLMIEYTYSDPATGKTLYVGRQAITVGAGESIVQSIKVRFYSEGVYDLMIQVESDDGTLAFTDILVSVPWLSVYLYMLIAVAAIVIVLSAFFVFFAMRKSRLLDKDVK